MNKNTLGEWMLLIVGIPLSLVVTWMMAMAGEPRSVWLICDILKLCGSSI